MPLANRCNARQEMAPIDCGMFKPALRNRRRHGRRGGRVVEGAQRAFGARLSGKGVRLRAHAVGEVAEWLKAHAWKVCIRETVSRVRIPLSPPAPGVSGPDR